MDWSSLEVSYDSHLSKGGINLCTMQLITDMSEFTGLPIAKDVLWWIGHKED